MPIDPYVANRVQENFYVRKTPIGGRLVVVLKGHVPDRGLELIPQRSRAALTGEVHELIITAEPDAAPGGIVNRIAYLGFFEVKTGGVLLVGDELRIGGHLIGHLAGYDYAHMPNHMNIVISAAAALSGDELNLELDSSVTFEMPAR